MNDYLNNPLLLIIDMQNVYKEGQPWECKNYDNALSNVLALLDDGHFSQDNTILTRYIASAHPTGVWKNYNKEYAEINANQWYNDLDQELQQRCKTTNATTNRPFPPTVLKKSKKQCITLQA